MKNENKKWSPCSEPHKINVKKILLKYNSKCFIKYSLITLQRACCFLKGSWKGWLGLSVWKWNLRKSKEFPIRGRSSVLVESMELSLMIDLRIQCTTFGWRLSRQGLSRTEDCWRSSWKRSIQMTSIFWHWFRWKFAAKRRRWRT